MKLKFEKVQAFTENYIRDFIQKKKFSYDIPTSLKNELDNSLTVLVKEYYDFMITSSEIRNCVYDILYKYCKENPSEIFSLLKDKSMLKSSKK